MVTQESIIYRLMARNNDFDAFLKNSYFWRENGRGRYGGAKGSEASWPQDPTKKLAQWVDILGQPLSRKHVLKYFGPP